jgi:L-lactate dehydrogenase complex protein LldE
MVKVLQVQNVALNCKARQPITTLCGLRECKIKQEPRNFLPMSKGLELIELNDVETCVASVEHLQ